MITLVVAAVMVVGVSRESSRKVKLTEEDKQKRGRLWMKTYIAVIVTTEREFFVGRNWA